jgi:hypothetical protein
VKLTEERTMPGSGDIVWFKPNFSQSIETAVADRVFDVDMLCAIACQETGSIWSILRRKPGLDAARIAALCCGDTLDADKGRRAFPRKKADLVAVADGPRMFEIARAALLAMAEYVPGYEFARTNPRKFAHGFGIFQYDLQFFLSNPTFFLERKYESFDLSLAHAIGELRSALRKLGWQGRASITDLEFCHVAIAYNTGGFNPAKGLRQGHFDGKRFYGESIRDFLALARATSSEVDQAKGRITLGSASLEAGRPSATGPAFEVVISGGMARLRDAPKISQPKSANVGAELPDGQVFLGIHRQRRKWFHRGGDNSWRHTLQWIRCREAVVTPQDCLHRCSRCRIDLSCWFWAAASDRR